MSREECCKTSILLIIQNNFLFQVRLSLYKPPIQEDIVCS